VARTVSATQSKELLGQKDLPLSLDHVLDNVRTKMFELEICLVDSRNAGVGVVVALHGEEKAVERSAEIGTVENWSDEIVWVASSGEFDASCDCALFQLELVEFCHCFCESTRLKIEFIILL
jgi:hypothetical protein